MLSDISIFKKTFKNDGQGLEIVFDNLGICTLYNTTKRAFLILKKFSKDWRLWLIKKKKKNIFKL